MFKKSSLWSAPLIASLAAGSITSAVAAENAIIPNFASADFGWLLQGGIDSLPPNLSTALAMARSSVSRRRGSHCKIGSSRSASSRGRSFARSTRTSGG